MRKRLANRTVSPQAERRFVWNPQPFLKDIAMKTLASKSHMLAAVALLVVAPLTQATGLTREQVKAELAEAVRNGDMIVGEQGRTEYERAPHRFPARVVVVGKTRDQVMAELAEAIRLGDAPLTGDNGLTPAELYPQRFAAVRATHALAMKAQGEHSAQGAADGPIVR